jgi:hypothetical protein
MHYALRPHPDCRCDAITSIDVDVERNGAALTLRYRVLGDIAALVLPPVSESVRADGLWQHTCFEAFVRENGSRAYCELNFSPSTEWDAYLFDDYRQGVRNADIARPAIAVRSSEREFELRGTAMLPAMADAPWRLALSAVIEEASGRKSYWALAHPPGKPDFHHPDCFVAELARPSPS